MQKRHQTFWQKPIQFTVLGLLLILSSCSQEKSSISNKIPELTLPNLVGEKKSLNKSKAKVQLIVFWATWCQPCLIEIPHLIRLHEKYKAQGFEVVSINVDDPTGQIVGQIYATYGINYEVFLGSDETMVQFGNVEALPTSFFVNQSGSILEKIEGLRSESYFEAKIENYLKVL